MKHHPYPRFRSLKILKKKQERFIRLPGSNFRTSSYLFTPVLSASTSINLKEYPDGRLEMVRRHCIQTEVLLME